MSKEGTFAVCKFYKEDDSCYVCFHIFKYIRMFGESQPNFMLRQVPGCVLKVTIYRPVVYLDCMHNWTCI